MLWEILDFPKLCNLDKLHKSAYPEFKGISKIEFKNIKYENNSKFSKTWPKVYRTAWHTFQKQFSL